MTTAGQTGKRAEGYAMAAMLVAIAVMTVAMTVALPAWRQDVRREKEEELVFRGRQYVRAIQLFQRKFAAAYPPDIDTLVKQKFLRKKYKDPMTGDGQFEVLYQGTRIGLGPSQPAGSGGQGQAGQSGPVGMPLTFDSGSGAITQGTPAGGVAGEVVGARGGVIGVRSKSTEASLRIYNGAAHYNEWLFVFLPTSVGRGQARPGMGGGPGRGYPGGMGGPGGPGAGRGGPQRGGRGFER
jgi:type II secretory pathway pseudopilin PulG